MIRDCDIFGPPQPHIKIEAAAQFVEFADVPRMTRNGGSPEPIDGGR